MVVDWHSSVSMTDKMSAAPGGSRMFAFFNDVDDFRTNLSTICHTHSEVTTSRQKNCTIITTKAFTALNCWLGGRKAYYVSDRYCCNNLVLICTQSGSGESMKYSNK